MLRLLPFLLILLATQAQAQTRTFTVHVEPYKGLSYGAFFKSLVIKTDVEGPEHIQGFEFQWGRAYELKVRSEKLRNPPMDGSDTEYTLLRVEEEGPAPVGLEFDLRLERELYLGPGENESTFEVVNDSTFRYFGEIELEVPAALRPDFDKVLAGTERVGRFIFVDHKRIRLIGFKR